VIPKYHGAKLTDIPDEDLLEILVSGYNSNCDGDEDGWIRARERQGEGESILQTGC
jgi:hypothetical protein